ncbi:hypothetical protein MNBD_GAMMA15-596 [hydrothermal vent metagenome]|uniref:AB hydrolase-1 domain-containing protein n=1 Tax=hydrothermal vent metagenome TaxID=652676 RepID=A0A3B0YWA6_9ZZZZ
MQQTLKLLVWLIFSMLATTLCFAASDQAKEKRWAEQITDSLMDGEVHQLEAAGTSFLSIFTKASGRSTGRAVIIAHGMGVHPNWADVIQPLRVGLTEHGWSTLSIQMPILPNDADLKDYIPLFDEATVRIDAAVAMLRKRGNHTIILIGHSLGATMTAWHLANKKKPDVQGAVFIGIGSSEIDEKTNGVLSISKMGLPILDIYGSRDLNGVLSSVDARRSAAIRAGNKSYRQIEVEGADHFFTGMQDVLVRRIYGWLKSSFVKK